jgi:hypothetical protein
VLDSEGVSEEDDALDSEDAAGVCVSGSVVPAVSAGVACSVVVVWLGSVSVDWVLGEAACGDCVAALSAFVDPVVVVSRSFASRARAREDFPFVSVPFVAALALLPGKAWAASSVKIPVSVAEPASSQRLHCFSRLSAASRELLVGEVLTGTYSTP